MKLESNEAAELHRRVTGRGPLVICLHASGSSSSQWEPLMQAVADRYCVTAFDLHGHGRSATPTARYRLATDTDAVLRAVAHASRPLHLVGHSFGGAIALDAALRLGAAVASVTVYEPVLFGLLHQASAEYREVVSVGRAVVRAVAVGRLEDACARFIDYWSGAGSWAAMPEAARQRIAARIAVVAGHFDTLFSNPLPLERLQTLDVPVRLLHGDLSPAAALAVVRRLTTLDAVVVERIAGAGHMGPITHASQVTSRVVAHLDANRAVETGVAQAA